MVEKLKVMLIDDDTEVLESLSESLDSRGFHIKAFENPNMAIEAYKSNSFDIVITDLKMPEVSGFDVIKAIRERNPEACVIIVTSYDSPDHQARAKKQGAYKFYRKPLLDMDGFISTLHKIEHDLENNRQRPNKKKPSVSSDG